MCTVSQSYADSLLSGARASKTSVMIVSYAIADDVRGQQGQQWVFLSSLFAAREHLRTHAAARIPVRPEQTARAP